MLGRGVIRHALGSVVGLIVAMMGCETLHNAGVPGLEGYVKVDPAIAEKEQSCRDNFALRRDHDSLYWLLSHGVRNGMNLREVEDVIGEPGEQTDDFNAVSSEGLRQTTDLAYKWGPDSIGDSVVIWFRDGHVLNFNPEDYRKPKRVEESVDPD